MTSEVGSTQNSPIDIFGYTGDGDLVKTVHLTGQDGMTASVLTLGARLLDLRMPDGRPLTLSFASLEHVEADPAYVGVAVGRTANRIRGGQLRRQELVGANILLEKNEHGRNHTHGGRRAWDKRLFAVRERSESQVELFLYSPDGDQGYPSSVEVSVRYRLTGSGEIAIALSTTNVGTEPTVTNMTVHPYFDLSGRGGRVKDAVLDYNVVAPLCANYLVLDADNVPTGEMESVKGTKFDFLALRKIDNGGETFSGYDQYFIASHTSALDGPVKSLVKISAPAGEYGPAVEMEVLSNQPGFQMYTANGFNGSGYGAFEQFGSIAVEPSGFIDAGNHNEFPTIILQPSETRNQLITYRFTTVSK